MIPIWKLYECNFCFHKRVVQINATQPYCTFCRRLGQKMIVKEWLK